jgi:hypothetical protein
MNVRFHSVLRVEKIKDDKWRVLESFCFEVDDKRIWIPKFYVTDFASVPRLPFAYLVAGNVSHIAPLIHDFLYYHGYDREWSDNVFYHALLEEGVTKWRAWSMWVAVRIGGSFFYNDEKVKAR